MSTAKMPIGMSGSAAALAYIYDRLVLKHFDPARGALAAAPNRAPAPQLQESNLTPEARRLWEEVTKIEWYHSIPLTPEITTPGQFDHAPYLENYPVPASLAGKRVLEVACYDGYWSFLMEQRGAAESVAVDIAKVGDMDMPFPLRTSLDPQLLETPTGAGFRFAHQVLNSKVQRVPMSVYDLDPGTLGQFDFVFMSDLLIHIMNPVKAVQAVRALTRGEAVFVECFNPLLPDATLRYKGFKQSDLVWWAFSLGALRNIFKDAGFRQVDLFSSFRTGKRGERPWMWHAAFIARV